MVWPRPGSSPPARISTASAQRIPPTPSSRATPRRPGASPSGISIRARPRSRSTSACRSRARARQPWIDPTLAVFERRATPPASSAPLPSRAKAAMYVSGFENMKRLAHRVALEGARVVVGGHSTVPFAARGEAPWREMELLVDSGFTPLEVITAATGTAAGFLYRERELGTLQAGRFADLVVLSGDPLRNIA